MPYIHPTKLNYSPSLESQVIKSDVYHMHQTGSYVDTEYQHSAKYSDSEVNPRYKILCQILLRIINTVGGGMAPPP